MRFNEIKKFNIEELLLDEGNYRFNAAGDQQACIEKIYSSNHLYFKNLMTSVAQDNLGELLLVYIDGDKNIVLDGNRRLATLKVLYNPEMFAPSASIKEHAENLLKLNNIDFNNIQAQVSNDKALIYKTVYERHAAGQGKARIDWSAYGAARFRYDNNMEKGDDWNSMALLLETEKKHPQWTDFIDSNEYSHEVFRRIFRSAQERGIISDGIFSGRHQRIKKSSDKSLLNDAVKKVVSFLEALKNKELSLARGAKYADKASVDAFVDKFNLSPDNLRAQPPSDSDKLPNKNGSENEDSQSNANDDQTTSNNTANNTNTNPTRDKQKYGIDESINITNKLKYLKSKKLSGLYHSLCTVSLSQHPQLLYAGAWSFFESLSTLIGKTDGTSFESYIGSKMNNEMPFTKGQRKDFAKPLKDISETGNLNKHSGTYHSTSANQLRVDFTTLEPLILGLMDIHINKIQTNNGKQ